MPSDLWRKRVTNFESKFTDFYMKVQLNLFLFLFACFAVYYACCYSCYCYHDLVKQRYICNEFQPYVQVRDNFCHVSLSYFVILSLFCVISCITVGWYKVYLLMHFRSMARVKWRCFPISLRNNEMLFDFMERWIKQSELTLWVTFPHITVETDRETFAATVVTKWRFSSHSVCWSLPLVCG